MPKPRVVSALTFDLRKTYIKKAGIWYALIPQARGWLSVPGMGETHYTGDLAVGQVMATFIASNDYVYTRVLKTYTAVDTCWYVSEAYERPQEGRMFENTAYQAGTMVFIRKDPCLGWLPQLTVLAEAYDPYVFTEVREVSRRPTAVPEDEAAALSNVVACCCE